MVIFREVCRSIVLPETKQETKILESLMELYGEAQSFTYKDENGKEITIKSTRLI